MLCPARCGPGRFIPHVGTLDRVPVDRGYADARIPGSVRTLDQEGKDGDFVEVLPRPFWRPRNGWGVRNLCVTLSVSRLERRSELADTTRSRFTEIRERRMQRPAFRDRYARTSAAIAQ